MVTRQDLEGRVAVVTGASRGIGKTIALRLAEAGASVALLDVNAAGLETTAGELEGLHPGRRFFRAVCDVGSLANVQEVVDRIVAELGRIDILVNNAGITRDNLLLRMSEEEWDLVMTVNLKGTFNVSKAVSRHMLKARSGRIVNIASIVGLIGNPGQTNYSASKGGVISFTFSLARELGSRGIGVNAVAPGFIDTDMTAKLSDEARKALAEKIPMGRLGKPEDVAEVVLFLAGPASGYITGEVIRVDGGMAIG